MADLGWIPPIASAVASLATLGGVIFAAWKASTEWGKWKQERQITKRAEVAGEALVVTLQFLSGLVEVTSIAVGKDDLPPEGEPAAPWADQLEKRLERRWIKFEPLETRFREMWELVEVYLPDEASQVMREVSDKQIAIRGNQLGWIEQARHGGTDSSFYKGAVGQRDPIGVLRKRALAILRPYAQMSDVPAPERFKSSWWSIYSGRN